jgi:hypothetical protein
MAAAAAENIATTIADDDNDVAAKARSLLLQLWLDFQPDNSIVAVTK